MAKIQPANCKIYTSDRGEVRRVQFTVNGHLFFRDNMPLDSKVDIHTWLYDKVFDNCPLSWSDFCKVKIDEAGTATPPY